MWFEFFAQLNLRRVLVGAPALKVRGLKGARAAGSAVPQAGGADRQWVNTVTSLCRGWLCWCLPPRRSKGAAAEAPAK